MTALRAARVALMLAAGLTAGAAALSVAQTVPASETATAASPAAPAVPVVRSVDIALVLPLDTPAYARAADAVRTGVLDAAGAAGARARIHVFAHGEDGVLGAFDSAAKAGARVIVGPLLRDDLKIVSALTLELPYTIALNQIEGSVDLPATLYTFPLSIESDGRLIARRIHGAPPPPSAGQGVAILSSDTALMQRFTQAFANEWLTLGGSAPTTFRYDGTVESLTHARRELGRQPPAAVLLALDGINAARAKPYVGALPSFASALVFERDITATVRDLDGLVIAEIPWIVTPNAPEFAGVPRRDFPSAALTRLYALGLDAYRAASAFQDTPPVRLTFDGATGRITLDGHHFAREGRLAVYREGVLVPFDGPR